VREWSELEEVLLVGGPSIGRISCDADVDHSARFHFEDVEGEKRAEEEESRWERRRRPRSALHECVRMRSTSVQGLLIEAVATVPTARCPVCSEVSSSFIENASAFRRFPVPSCPLF
jgi:hypothetical protein